MHAFAWAGLLTLVFHLLLGDEAGYRQYLAVVTHAFLIGALGSLLLVPLRAIQADAQLTLNLGLFLPFDASTYLGRLLRALDLFMIWAWIVVGLGVAALDRRRTSGSAIGIVMVLATGFVMLIALINPGG